MTKICDTSSYENLFKELSKNRFKCKICDQRFFYEDDTIAHINEIHQIGINSNLGEFYVEEIISLDLETEKRLNGWNKNLTCGMTEAEWEEFYRVEELRKKYPDWRRNKCVEYAKIKDPKYF